MSKIVAWFGLFAVSTALLGCGGGEQEAAAPPPGTSSEELAPGAPTQGPEAGKTKPRTR